MAIRFVLLSCAGGIRQNQVSSRSFDMQVIPSRGAWPDFPVRTSTYALPNPLGAGYARFATQNYPRASDTDPTEADELGILYDTASVRTAHAPAGPVQHAPRAMTRKRFRKIHF
jgi:hypothetical protein